jgi:hypothetical protein
MATGDGEALRFLVDGVPVGTASAKLAATGLVTLGARLPGAPGFAGHLAGFAFTPRLPGADDLAQTPPDETLTRFEDASPSWPLQVKTNYGLAIPQPVGTAEKQGAISGAVAQPLPDAAPLEARARGATPSTAGA